MVAYSFKKRFVPLIEDGTKRQTIRAHRKRHAHVGEHIQLYFAQRTKHCRKIISDPVSTGVYDIKIDVGVLQLNQIILPRRTYMPVEFDQFAQLDGFSDAKEMWEFWKDSHGVGRFNGVLIKWAAYT